MSDRSEAVLHRMVMPAHTCPYGLKALDLLRRKGFAVDDLHLTTREETDAFKAAQGVRTTPQVFIDGVRIGGYDDLRRHLGMSVAEPGSTSYRPVAALFAIAALLAIAASHAAFGSPFSALALQWFGGFSMAILALLKLQDIGKFSTMFLNYDLLAKRWVPYGVLYPFAEGLAGVLMVADALEWLSIPIALFIGTVGAVSVFKAVYIDGRELKCACVGGSSNVPLGFVSLTENLGMIAMAIWMLTRM
ncbi:glutaredoxin [Sphingomonas sp. PvP107]